MYYAIRHTCDLQFLVKSFNEMKHLFGVICFYARGIYIFPRLAGLFHRGISQSGNFYNPWTLTPPGSAKKNAIILGKNLRCNTEDSAEFIKCLRTKDAKEIIGSDRLYQVN